MNEPVDTVVGGVDVQVLGPVVVFGPLGQAVLVGSRQRAVVGLLALKVGTPVSQSRLVDALWGEQPPRTAVKSLHSHVARVRQALVRCGLPDVLVTSESRYLLAVDPDAVDVRRFEQHARHGSRDLADQAPDRAAMRLRRGLALWRDDLALADVEPHGWAAAEVQRLAEVRLTAITDRWTAELQLGRHTEAVGELERLLVAHPTQERLVRLLMLALYRAERPTGALDAYQRLRARLADEFGTDPGPELVRLHTRILRRDPGLDPPPDSARSVDAGAGRDEPRSPAMVPAAAVAPAATVLTPRPAQLPGRVGHFTGRRHELAMLDRLVDDSARETGVAVVSGPGGIGKTALAVEWAHRVAGRFADGQLFVDLRGHEPGSALSSTDALAHLLRSLGVATERVPAELAEQAALYRSLLHQRQVLIVVDNCPNAEVVLPLVPAGRGNLLVVTARTTMTVLSTHHAVCVVDVDVLTEAEALTLLDRVLGAGVVLDQPAAAADLVRLCDRMPLALRIAAAKLSRQRTPAIAALAAELAGAGRLDVLSVDGGSRSVRAVFASAYNTLSRPAARLFRLLGLHPGPSIHVHLAAACADVASSTAGELMADLAAAHLLTAVGPDRYRLHDLVAEFARHCAGVDEAPAGCAAAVARVVDWYLSVAGAANRVVDPGRDRVTPNPSYRPTGLPFAAEHHAALAFLDDERENLLPVARCAAEHGHDTATWQLTYLLTGFYESRGHRHERVQMCGWGVRAAQRGGDPATEGLMHSALGVACVAAHRYEDALRTLHRALELARSGDDRRGEGHVHNNIAVAYSGLRRFDDALAAFRQALAVHSANGYRLGVALALNNAGHTAVRMGRPELSASDLGTALRMSREIGNPRLEAAVLDSLGEAELGGGAPDHALGHFAAALALYRQLGDRRYEAETLNGLGLAHLAKGRPALALDVLREALTLTRDIGDAHLEACTLRNLAQAELAAGDPAGAVERLHQALTLRSRVPDPYEQAHVHRDLSALAERRGEQERAGHHARLAVGLYRGINATDEAQRLTGRLQEAAQPAVAQSDGATCPAPAATRP